MIETLAYGYLSESTQRESYPINTNMTGFRWFPKIFAFLCCGRSSLSIGRVNTHLCSEFPFNKGRLNLGYLLE